MPATSLSRLLERILLPPEDEGVRSPDIHAPTSNQDDFRRVVAAVAVVAVSFIVPALYLARVPTELWLPFLGLAALVGALLGASFMVVRAGSPLALLSAFVNVTLVGMLTVVYAPYFHQLSLLFALVVAAHAVIHGLGPALVSAAMGAVLVPILTQGGAAANPTDFGYAFIYLFGTALLPWAAGRLARRRAVALREQLAATLATEREAVFILARAAEAKDHVTGEHVREVADLAEQLALRTGFNTQEAADLRFAAMLHDVGKLHLPDLVLQKPGPLTADEWELVKQHTIWGERILGTSAGFELARRVARSHHENFDGSGYPDGLNGSRIPIEARIVRLVDVLDAMRQERPYKPAWPIEKCIDEIARGVGSQFDPDLARELLEMFEPGAAAVRLPEVQSVFVPKVNVHRPPKISPVQALDGLMPVTLATTQRRHARRLARVSVTR
ncbi:MAG TPA: HD domain-containing phosphohydrolase [Candidatus Limnocylindrales bacterium]|nr:HD domain-containing phosphohydrolase [Candidatus Limnocylindrales bacterium]